MKIDRSLSLGNRRILAGSVATALLPESIARLGASQPLSRRNNRRFRILSAKGFLALGLLFATTKSPQAEGSVLTLTIGPSPNGTFYAPQDYISLLSAGSVPVGSILQSVSINATLWSTNNDNWAAEFSIFIDPTPLTPGVGANLYLGTDYTPRGGAAQSTFWSNGYDGPVSTVNDTKTFGISEGWNESIDLSSNALFVANGYGDAGSTNGGFWSGTITLVYGAAASTIVWSGTDATSPTQWSTAPGVINFLNGATPVAFADGDGVTFNDSASGSHVVDISGANVSPSATTFNNTGANTYTLTGSHGITGPGDFTKDGNGLLIIENANSYDGLTKITAGTVQLNNVEALPHGSGKGNIRVNGTLDVHGLSPTINGLLGTGTVTTGVAGALTLTVGDGSSSSSFSGIIQDGAGQIGLTKTGAGTLTLSGLSTYTGKTIIQEGTLYLGLTNNSGTGLTNAGVPGPMGAPTGANAVIDMYNGTALQTGDTNPRVDQTTNRTINLAGTGAGTVTIKVNDNDTNFTFGSVTATGTGAKTLALFTGFRGNGDREAIIFNGSINDGTVSTVGLQVTFRTQTGSSSYVSLNEGGTFTGPITLIKGNPETCSYYLTIGGTQTRNLITPGSGTLGTVSPGVGSYAGNISLDTETIFHYVSSASQTLSGAISGAGSILVDATGSLILAGTGTYTGGTTVNHGTLATGAINALPSAGTVTLANASTAGLALNGFNQQIAILTGGGAAGGNVALGGAILTVGNNTPMTYSGAISGAAGITKVGTGVMTLAGQSTYSGPTTISTGTLKLEGPANILPIGTALTLAGSTTLNLNSVNQQIGSLADGGVEPQNHRVLLGSATLTVGDSTSTTFTGAITGSTGSVTKVGSGKLTLTGFNVYSGSTSLNAGILAVSGDEAIGSTGTAGSILKFNGGTLETTADFNSDRRINVFAPGGNFNTNGFNATLTGVISGVGTLTKTGAGTLTLDPAADLTALGGLTAGGGTTLIDGQLGNGSAVASATNGGHLAFGTVSQTLASLNIGAGSTVSFSGGAASAFGAPGFKSTALVPEPGTIGLLLVGTLGVLGRRRRD